MCGPGQVAKHMWVESLEPSKVNQEEAPISYQQPMARHLTKVVMHQELTDVGDAEEEMGSYGIQDAEANRVQNAEEIPLPHMTANVMQGTEAVSTQECVVQEAWCGWWESLRAAHRMRRVAVAALQDVSRGEAMVCVKKLTQEAENLK